MIASVCSGQIWEDCRKHTGNPEFPGDPTLCETITDFSSTPVIIGTGGVHYWTQQASPAHINKDIIINGYIIIDATAYFQNCRIKLQFGSKILVTSGNRLFSFSSKWFTCEYMWEGFEVQDEATLVLGFSHLEDAYTLITADDGARLAIYGNYINRNYIGITNGTSSANYGGMIIHYFGNNTFTCTSDLNQRGPFQIVGSIPEAAIFLNSGTFIAGGMDIGPTYISYMYNGIRLERSVFVGTRVHISDIFIDLNDGTRGVGIFQQNSMLKLEASYVNDEWIGYSTFARCENGIYSRRSSLDLRATRFEDMELGGIECSHNNASQFVSIRDCEFNFDLESSVGAIIAERSIASGNVPHVVVSDNTINFTESFEGRGFGISVIDRYGASIDEARIERNNIKLDVDNDFSGITVFNVSSLRYKLLSNNIASLSSVGPWPIQRIGILCYTFFSGSENEVSLNEVIGSAVESSLHVGIHMKEFVNTVMCDNFTGFTEDGIRISGDNTNFDFANNRMGRHINGLVIEDAGSPGMIGTQTRRDNRWSSAQSYGAYAALCTADALFNQFIVQSSATAILPEPRSPGGSTWFRVESGDVEPCSDGPVFSITVADSLLAEGVLYDGSWSFSAGWSARKKLMLKLIREPSLVTSETWVEDFYDDYKTESEGLHAQAEYDFIGAMLSPEGHAEADILYEKMNAWVDSLLILQAENRQIDTLCTDTVYLAKFGAFQDSVLLLLDAYQEVTTDITDEQKTALQSLLSSLSSLPVDSTYEEYSRDILEIRITWFIDDTLSADHRDRLFEIAGDTPEAGGISVSMAQLMLGPCAEEEEEELLLAKPFPEVLHPAITQDQVEQVKAEMSAKYDTPAKSVHVQWNTPVSGIVYVFDLTGRELYKSSVTEETLIIFPLHVAPGIYVVTYDDRDSIRETHKILVQ